MNIQSLQEVMAFAKRPDVPWQTHRDRLFSEGGVDGRNYLKSRMLGAKSTKHFRIGFSENREIVFPVFKDDQLVDYKYRSIDEKKFRRHAGGETWVVNEQAFQYADEDKYIICVEGEFDAIALFELGFRSVVSTTGGAQGPTTWINKIPKDVKIIINYDNDEPGQEAAYKLAERIGIEKCFNIILSQKDANDFLM